MNQPQLPVKNTWNPAHPDSIECLQIVFKVAERCNINCTYCYYFNMGDETPFERPARASVAVAEQLADWVVQGCTELGIPKVMVSFHGGEPMLVKTEVFDRMCQVLTERIGAVAELRLAIQTNGTILDEKWIECLHRHRVAVGVSIDGDRVAHDRHRLDHKGLSTFDQTQANLRQLVSAAGGEPARLPSTISVLDARVDYRETYAYLRDLGVEAMAFLLPDRSADDVAFRDGPEPARFGERMYELFESWFVEDNPSVRIRFVDETLRFFRVGLPHGVVAKPRKNVQILIVRSDGTVALDDSYIPALEWYSATPSYAMGAKTLREVFMDPIFLKLEELEQTLPHGCCRCRWREVCRGGDLENRFTKRGGFDNPSVYCESFKVFYSLVCDLLGENGYPKEEIVRRFGDSDARLHA